jgi:hypothetical protein
MQMSIIITEADFTSYTGKPTSPLVTQVVKAMNQWIETRTHRCWGETKSVTERYDYQRSIMLRHMDVQSITTVKFGLPTGTQQIVGSQSYYTNQFGRLILLPALLQIAAGSAGAMLPNNPSMFRDYVEITYTYGTTDVPEDLKMAALGIAYKFYNYAHDSGQDIVATSVGSYRVQYAGSVRGVSGQADPAKSTADANFQIVDSYRMQRS